MTIPIYQVDAFTDAAFAGNPAAVCLLEGDATDAWMQRVAAEMNLSETAFVMPQSNGFHLRWFTPVSEVDLCGHATLASSHVLWSEVGYARNAAIEFSTRSGQLTARLDGHRIELDFPSRLQEKIQAPAGLVEALGVTPRYVGRSVEDLVILLDDAAQVRAARPDFEKLRRTESRGVILTAPSDDGEHDFISRFFAPAVGIDEDPVTGSAHCCLAPFWQARLSKNRMTGYQASARGGTVEVEMAGDRVKLRGQAVTVLRGQLLPEPTFA